MPRLHEHPRAPLAPDADADDVSLAAELDLDPAILVTAVDPPLLLGAGVAKEPAAHCDGQTTGKGVPRTSRLRKVGPRMGELGPNPLAFLTGPRY